MVARKVAARLKPNSLAKFANLIEHEVLPWLREQDGFLDLLTLAAPDGREVTTISFWDHPANAQAYNANAYPDSLKILGELLDGTPYVKTFEVISSTLKTFGGTPRAALIAKNASAPIGYRTYGTNL